jgi:hypothetical protein
LRIAGNSASGRSAPKDRYHAGSWLPTPKARAVRRGAGGNRSRMQALADAAADSTPKSRSLATSRHARDRRAAAEVLITAMR